MVVTLVPGKQRKDPQEGCWAEPHTKSLSQKQKQGRWSHSVTSRRTSGFWLYIDLYIWQISSLCLPSLQLPPVNITGKNERKQNITITFGESQGGCCCFRFSEPESANSIPKVRHQMLGSLSRYTVSFQWVAQATKRSRLKDRKSDPVPLRFLFYLSNITK